MISADKTRSVSMAKSKRSEAERATKAANDAEKKRAAAEKKLVSVEFEISKNQNKYEKEREAAQAKALADLSRKADQASAQFSPPWDTGLPGVLPLPISVELEHDVFLSHASEDKDAIARPLRDALEERDVSVWFDEIKIKVGQSIRQRIEEGIARRRFGVVILSPNFFAKQWTRAELDGLFSRKMDSGENMILPVWHHVSKDEVMQHSPLLVGIAALNTATMTLEEIADSLADAVRT
jgi:predicted nucleotide-binding protein